MAEEEKKLTINKEEQNEAEDIKPVLDDEMKEVPGGGIPPIMTIWPVTGRK